MDQQQIDAARAEGQKSERRRLLDIFEAAAECEAPTPEGLIARLIEEGTSAQEARMAIMANSLQPEHRGGISSL